MDGFGSRLIKLREKKGLNQRQLAEILNITPTRLNYWEKDKREPDFFMFSKIVQILDADANELLGLNQINNFHVSAIEKKLLNAYREHTEMQPAINKMLDIDYDDSIEKDITSEKTSLNKSIYSASRTKYPEYREIAAYDVDDTPDTEQRPIIEENSAD